MADAIGITLLNYGVLVFDTQQTSNLLLRLNLDEIEVMRPQNLSLIYENGVEAVMFVRVVAGYDDAPQSASVRIVHTLDGELVGGVAWQNARALARGSAADAMVRKDVVEAAEEIAESLAVQMRWQ